MFKHLSRFIFLFVFLPLLMPVLATAQAQDTSWESWLVNQIKQHPEVVAAREQMNSNLSLADAQDRPLYNPELDSEYEREGSANNYRIGMSQTIDWRGKREVRQQQANFLRAAAKQNYALALQEKIAESLQALIQWQAASKQSELALQQESQMDTLISLVTDRQNAGDLGQVDAELTLLSFSQRLNDTAQAQAQLRQVEARLGELLPDWPGQWTQIPAKFWNSGEVYTNTPEQWSESHAAVIAARAEWEVMQQAAELASRETKADPTFGINAGKTDRDNVVGLTFSIPLNIRNNFSAEARAANQAALSAEAQYLAVKRRQQFAIKASQAALQEYQQRFDRWQGLMQGRGERSGSLLEAQWQSGDLSTTEYLLALQQRSEGLVAGIELATQFKLARIDWLLQIGQLNAALTQLGK